MLLLNHGDRSAFPSADNYTFKVTMEERSKEYSIQLCAAQMRGSKWQAALYNPARTVPMEYSMSFRKKVVSFGDGRRVLRQRRLRRRRDVAGLCNLPMQKPGWAARTATSGLAGRIVHRGSRGGTRDVLPRVRGR